MLGKLSIGYQQRDRQEVTCLTSARRQHAGEHRRRRRPARLSRQCLTATSLGHLIGSRKGTPFPLPVAPGFPAGLTCSFSTCRVFPWHEEAADKQNGPLFWCPAYGFVHFARFFFFFSRVSGRHLFVSSMDDAQWNGMWDFLLDGCLLGKNLTGDDRHGICKLVWPSYVCNAPR